MITNLPEERVRIFTNKKFIGVGTCKVVAVNPNNEALRKLGFEIPDDYEEFEYVSKVQYKDTEVQQLTLRFLVKVDELPDTILPLTFKIKNAVRTNNDGTKAQIIDDYGRSAWGTIEDVKAGKIPVYSSGKPASICEGYRKCRPGEADLILFLRSLLGARSYERYDSDSGSWVKNENPTALTIDDWKKLMSGDVSEINDMLALRPDAAIRIIFGVNMNDEGVFQTFYKDAYLGVWHGIDLLSGNYFYAQKLIDKYNTTDGTSRFGAYPIHEWKNEEVKKKDSDSDFVAPKHEDSMFDTSSHDDDLPF